MSHTQIKLLAMALLLSAPDKQVFRGQLIYNAIKHNRLDDATEQLIIAASSDIGSEWSGQCMQLAEHCYQHCENHAQPRKVLIAALLGLQGRRDGIDSIDINAAVHLANIHLDRGHSSAKALSEGRNFLTQLTSRQGVRQASASPGAHPAGGDA